MNMKKSIIAVSIASLLAGCTTTQLTPNQKIAAGAVGGALVGGVLGHQVNHKRGRYVGAIAGALAGGAIMAYMNKQQRAFDQSPELRAAGITVTRIDEATIKLNLPNKIAFAVNRADLNPAVYGPANVIANVLNQYPGTAVHVLGFTDSDGGDQFNLNLSQRRAQSVANYLSSRGVLQGRIVPRGYGEAYPVASNATTFGKAQNRRAEIYIRAIQQGNEQAAYAPII